MRIRTSTKGLAVFPQGPEQTFHDVKSLHADYFEQRSIEVWLQEKQLPFNYLKNESNSDLESRNHLIFDR